MSASLFVHEAGRVRATALSTGPWDRAAQHGGAPAALLMRAIEALPNAGGLQLARLTIEYVRPVPVDLLEVHAEAVRPGRRVQLIEARVMDASGAEVVRARALQVARAVAREDLPPAEDPLMPPPPDSGRPNDLQAPFRPMFAPDAMEVVFVEGGFRTPGPATAWFRLRVRVVPGETPTPLQRLAAAGDFGNGISSPLSWDDHLFINPDLTLYVERPPRGEWIGLRARTRIHPGGIGISESDLFDLHGRVGRATQSLLVAPRRPTAPPPTDPLSR